MEQASAPAAGTSSIQQWVLRVFGLAGAALFAFTLVLTFSTPQWVERFAAEFIEARVAEKVNEGIDRLRLEPGDSALTKLAENLLRQNEKRVEQIRQDLKGRAQERWVAALAQVRDLSCECRDLLVQMLSLQAMNEMNSLQEVNQRLVAFIQSSYMVVVEKLQRDIRIFAATNAFVFLLLLLVSFLKPQAVRHLFVPGLLLCAATLLCAYFYVFEQNWLLTIIYSDYLGLGYAAWLGVAFLFLCDIGLNRGQVTTTLVNGIADVVGSSFSLVPC